jgi:hypothetical protein
LPPLLVYQIVEISLYRECVSMGAAGAQTRRSLGHHLLYSQILRLLVILRASSTFRSKFLKHALL